jgi:hypothetical protein
MRSWNLVGELDIGKAFGLSVALAYDAHLGNGAALHACEGGAERDENDAPI